MAHLIFAKWLRSSHKVCWQRKVSWKREPSSSCNAIRTCKNNTMNSSENWMKTYFSSQLFKISQCFLFIRAGILAWIPVCWDGWLLSMAEAILQYWLPSPLPYLELEYTQKKNSTNVPNNVPSLATVLYQMKFYSKGLHRYIKQITTTQTQLMQLHHLKHQHRALSISTSFCRTTSLGQNSSRTYPHTATMNTVSICPCLTENLNDCHQSKEIMFVTCNSLTLPNHHIFTYNLRVK